MEAIRAVYHGEARLHPTVMRKLMNPVASQTGTPQRIAPDLTDRELEVLRLVAEGMSNCEIADQLVISEKTVKTHISNLLSKLSMETWFLVSPKTGESQVKVSLSDHG